MDTDKKIEALVARGADKELIEQAQREINAALELRHARELWPLVLARLEQKVDADEHLPADRKDLYTSVLIFLRNEMEL